MSHAICVPVATVWTSPTAPRALDAAAVADVPDDLSWTKVLDAPARRDLQGRTLTQALVGEPVEVLSESDGWLEVVLPWQPSSTDPRGYRGWVRAVHVAPGVDSDGPYATVVVPVAATGGPAMLSYGTILPVLEQGPMTTRLGLPAGDSLTVQTHEVRLAEDASVDGASVLASARQFLGLTYLWGGTSSWGLDCSGFVHLTHRVAGLTIPRDAFDQADAARARDLDDTVDGDLYFFARPEQRPYHVGFATHTDPDRRTMLHAPEASDAVRIEDGPLSAHRARTLVCAGTFLG